MFKEIQITGTVKAIDEFAFAIQAEVKEIKSLNEEEVFATLLFDLKVVSGDYYQLFYVCQLYGVTSDDVWERDPSFDLS